MQRCENVILVGHADGIAGVARMISGTSTVNAVEPAAYLIAERDVRVNRVPAPWRGAFGALQDGFGWFSSA